MKLLTIKWFNHCIAESFSIPIFENTSPFDNGEIVLRDPENGDVCLIVNLNITLINVSRNFIRVELVLAFWC